MANELTLMSKQNEKYQHPAMNENVTMMQTNYARETSFTKGHWDGL